MSEYRIQYVLLTVTEPEEGISCRGWVCNSSESCMKQYQCYKYSSSKLDGNFKSRELFRQIVCFRCS